MTQPADLFGRPDQAAPTVRQLPLPLGWRSVGVQPPPLLITAPVAALVAALLDWRAWASPVAILRGPERSGKSLLAKHVADQSPEMTVIDPASQRDEATLFHAATSALGNRTPLLLIAEPDWSPQLSDLQTRIAAAQDFSVPAPEPDLMAAVLVRQLADHHVTLTWECAAWLAARMERSFAATAAVGEALVAAALADPRPLSLARARAIVSELGLLRATDDGAVAA